MACVAEQVGDTIPPQPKLSIEESRRDEQRHRTVVLSEDRGGNPAKGGISVVHCEGHGGRPRVAVALIDQLEYVRHADQPVPMATEVSQVIAECSGVLSHDAVLQVRKPVEREDRKETAPERAERWREKVRGGKPQHEVAEEAHGAPRSRDGTCRARPPNPRQRRSSPW